MCRWLPAVVTSTFPRKLSRGPYRNPRIYPITVTITAPVHENVVRFAVPRPAEDAFASRIIWREATGKIVRIVHPPGY